MGVDPILRRFDAHYTDPEFCHAMVARLIADGELRPGQVVWEAHCGAGAFVDALLLHGLRVIASDLDPDASYLQDELPATDNPSLSMARGQLSRCMSPWDARHGPPPPYGPVDWIIGNPPFCEFVPPRPCPSCGGTRFKKQRQGKLFLLEDGTSAGATPCKPCKGTGQKDSQSRPVVGEMIAAARQHARVGVAFVLPIYVLCNEEREALVAEVFECWPVNPRLRFVGKGTAPNEYIVLMWRRARGLSETPFRPLRWRTRTEEGEGDGDLSKDAG